MSNFDDAARAVVRVWDGLNGGQRRTVNEHAGHDLYRALHALGNEVDALTRAGTWNDGGAPEAGVPETPREYPAELRVTDLENALKAQHRRDNALHHACKSWGKPDDATDADGHALDVLVVAAAFDRFLADGTVHEVPDAPEDAAPEAPTELIRSTVMRAALAWVDRAHLRNPSGLENWRNWSDEHDQALINAVLAYRGLPPLERRES